MEEKFIDYKNNMDFQTGGEKIFDLSHTEYPEYKNQDVNGYNAGVGNVLTKGYGIVYGATTPNVYVVTNNFF
jgi:hypothetical protein